MILNFDFVGNWFHNLELSWFCGCWSGKNWPHVRTLSFLSTMELDLMVTWTSCLNMSAGRVPNIQKHCISRSPLYNSQDILSQWWPGSTVCIEMCWGLVECKLNNYVYYIYCFSSAVEMILVHEGSVLYAVDIYVLDSESHTQFYLVLLLFSHCRL